MSVFVFQGSPGGGLPLILPFPSNRLRWNLSKRTPRKGHCIKYLSTMDKTKSPNFTINIMRLEPLKEDNLYTGDKPLEFILAIPKVSVGTTSIQYWRQTTYIGYPKVSVAQRLHCITLFTHIFSILNKIYCTMKNIPTPLKSKFCTKKKKKEAQTDGEWSWQVVSQYVSIWTRGSNCATFGVKIFNWSDKFSV